MEFEVGAGQVIKGFDDAVVDMELNEEKNIKLKPEDAYGEHKENLVKKIPREKLPKEQEPKEGMMRGMQTQEGRKVMAKIIKVDDKEITIDLNHPLAGKNLNFKIKIVGIN